jgi:serine/threonine-protein kinase
MSEAMNETMAAPSLGDAPPSIVLGATLVGKYRIDEKLGEGGMGVVYGGTHLELKTRVAIKFLLADAARDPRAKARFLREARLAASIEGEHSTRIHDVTTDEQGRPFLVMEYLAGETADARLRREERLPLTDAVSIVLQLLDALAEAHARGLIHRDVKPANLFLTQRPGEELWVKVLDFGISKATDEGREKESITLTAPRTLLGSPEYMSPEQLRDSANVDLRSDLWACGVTLFELLTGKMPFQADTLPDLCAKVISTPPQTLADVGAADVPSEIQLLIAKCLEKDPALRPRNAYEVAVALAPFASDGGRALLPRIRAWCKESTGPISIAREPAPRRRVFAGGIALVAIAGVLAFAAASVRYATGPGHPSALAAVPPAPPSATVTATVAASASGIGSTTASAPPAQTTIATASASAPPRPTATTTSTVRVKPKHDLDGIDLLK